MPKFPYAKNIIVIDKAFSFEGRRQERGNYELLGVIRKGKMVFFFQQNGPCCLLPSRAPEGAIGAVLVGPKAPTRGY
jgi:hypothetical protein